MKIGILTQPICNNYGGILQNYALQTVLKRMGHEVVTLDWDDYRGNHEHIPAASIAWKNMKAFVSRYFLHRSRNYQSEQRRLCYLLSSKNREFAKNNIHLSEWLWGKEQFRQYVLEHGLDALIVGSDQTWRPDYNKNGMLNRMFLDFAEDLEVRRVSYAASFGIDDIEREYTPRQISEFSKLLQKFDAVSVREDSAVGLCENYFDVQGAVCTLDPTLLLSKEDYVGLLESNQTKPSHVGVFSYILDKLPSKMALVQTIAEAKHLDVVSLVPEWCNLGVVTPEEMTTYISQAADRWLDGFRQAAYIVGDSFHGMVFSIIFNKPFVVIGNSKRGMARFLSLLQMFGLEDRLVDESQDILKVLDTPIDWSSVNSRIEKKKLQSMDFLHKALG